MNIDTVFDFHLDIWKVMINDCPLLYYYSHFCKHLFRTVCDVTENLNFISGLHNLL